MVVQRLPGQRGLEHFALRRFGIAGVEEALRVLRPREVGKTHPSDFVGKVLALVEIADVDRLPVGAPFREPVREHSSIGRRHPLRERHRAVRREDVGIEHERRRCRQTRADVKRRLALQAAVLLVEVASALAHGNAHLGVIPQLRDPLFEAIAPGQPGEIVRRHLILGRHPGGDVRRVEVFHPPVRVGDLRAEVVVDDVALFRDRIGQFRGGNLPAAGDHDEEERGSGRQFRESDKSHELVRMSMKEQMLTRRCRDSCSLTCIGGHPDGAVQS